MKGFSDLLHLGDVLVRQDEPETRARSEAGDAQLKPALHRWAMTRIPDSAGAQNSAAQTALSIAGAAAMSGAVPVATAPPAAPVQPAVSKRSMTPDERQHFIMLLMLRETWRNPTGTLH